MPKNILIGALAAIVAVLGALAIVGAQSTTTAEVEVRVWRSASDHTRIYWTVRPEGGRWSTTERVTFPDTTSNRRWDYEDVSIEVEVEVAAPAPTTTATAVPTDAPTVSCQDIVRAGNRFQHHDRLGPLFNVFQATACPGDRRAETLDRYNCFDINRMLEPPLDYYGDAITYHNRMADWVYRDVGCGER